MTMANKKKRGIYGMGSMRLKGRIWHLKYHVDGEPRYESSKTTNKTEAAKLLAKRVSQARAPHRAEHTTVGELLDDLLEFYRINRPKSYRDFALPGVRTLKKYWERYLVPQVTTRKLQDYQAKRIKDGRANATVNREMALLRRAFTLGKESTPPRVAESPKFLMLPEDNVRRGFLRVEGYRAVLAELPDELKCLFVVGYHVGCRHGELLRIRVADVDMADRQITLHVGTTKNDEGRVLPIYGDMVESIRNQIEDMPAGCRWLFHRHGHRIKGFRDAWIQACERAGFPELLFHDLRRSAVRNLIRAGVPEKIAMTISGHKTRAMIDRYNIVDGEDVAEAGKKAEAFLRRLEIGKAKPTDDLVKQLRELLAKLEGK